MVKRIGGARRKTRKIMRKNYRRKGKLSITRFFAEFDEGQKVQLLAESSYQKGMYFRRFHGKVGTIVGKKGRCYEIGIKDLNKQKTLIVHPVHLKEV